MASLLIEFSHQHNTDDGNSIGSPCLPSSIGDDDHDGRYATQTGDMVTNTWVVGGVAFTIMILCALVGYTARVKRRAANSDDIESISSSSMFSPLLSNSDMDLESNVSTDIDPSDGERGLQLRSLALPTQPLDLTHAWRSSGMQLVVLDRELRVIIWSEGMVKAMTSLRPAPGTSIEELPFSSVSEHQTAISALESIMGEGGAESDAALHPLLALQAGVTTAPNVTLHLVTTQATACTKRCSYQ